MTAGKEIAEKTNTVGLTIDEIRGAIIEDRTTATALATEFYDRIRKEDSEIGAFLTLCEERALKQAGLIDQMAAEGQPLPPLAGVPVAIKDVMVTRGVRTTAGSKILENFSPPYDCTAVARLEAAGAVILIYSPTVSTPSGYRFHRACTRKSPSRYGEDCKAPSSVPARPS